ncbi:MAG: disulfide bond formation protein B [Alphaproteobacteria bacterium]|jgi:disulfide bond formation protein DsbB|nr:disulfide bond formation protein B [Alphaproteobacteria bacterium]MBP9878389.1 disulfide bond formation protein B [Alphaproteobacteria bacterium]
MINQISSQRMQHRMKVLLILFSGFALLGAFILEHMLDIVPCELCLLQRWAHLLTLLFGTLSLIKLNPKMSSAFFVIALFSLTVGAIIAYYQFGLEMRWWQSVVSCVPFPSTGDEALFMKNLAVPSVPCEIKGHTLFGLTLSAYNGLFSTIILLINIYATPFKMKKIK